MSSNRTALMERVVSHLPGTSLKFITKLGGDLGFLADAEQAKRETKTVHALLDGQNVKIQYVRKRVITEKHFDFKKLGELKKTKPNKIVICDRLPESEVSHTFGPEAYPSIVKLARKASAICLRDLSQSEAAAKIITSLPGNFKSVEIGRLKDLEQELCGFIISILSTGELESLILEHENPSPNLQDALSLLLNQDRWREINLTINSIEDAFLKSVLTWWESSAPSRNYRSLVVKLKTSQEATGLLRKFMTVKDFQKLESQCSVDDLGFIDDSDEAFETISLVKDSGEDSEIEESDEIVFELSHSEGKCARVKKAASYLEFKFC